MNPMYGKGPAFLPMLAELLERALRPCNPRAWLPAAVLIARLNNHRVARLLRNHEERSRTNSSRNLARNPRRQRYCDLLLPPPFNQLSGRKRISGDADIADYNELDHYHRLYDYPLRPDLHWFGHILRFVPRRQPNWKPPDDHQRQQDCGGVSRKSWRASTEVRLRERHLLPERRSAVPEPDHLTPNLLIPNIQ
jgi:hypothetical protein